MSQRHKINQASIEFNFSEPADAETFEQRSPQWVVQQLLPVIETVFDDMCPAQQTMVIDTLVLDLGDLSPQTFYEQAPQKLRQVLQEKLRSQLNTARQRHHAPEISDLKLNNEQAGDIRVFTQKQQRWYVLWQFLSTGMLPWSVSGNLSMDALGLSDELTSNSAQIIHALHHTDQREPLFQRMIEQFSAPCIATLFLSLTPDLQWEMMLLLLVHSKNETIELKNSQTQAWSSYFTQALTQHHLAPLCPHWEKLIHQFAPELIKVLYQKNTDHQLPWILVRDLGETERLQLLRVLTPQEYPFLTAILGEPGWWQIKKQPDSDHQRHHTQQILNQESAITSLAPAQIHQHLWLFTLHYLLIARGSEFNRQSYMSGLVIHMANAHNQTVEILLTSLMATLSHSGIDSRLRAQMLDLLQIIQSGTLSSANTAKPTPPDSFHLPLPAPKLPLAEISDSDTNSIPSSISHNQFHHLNELVSALCCGQGNQLSLYWPDNPQPFAALLRWCGQLEYVRLHWSENYTDETLLALVNILEPTAVPVVRTVLIGRHLFVAQMPPAIHTPSEHTTRISLWEFTFAFLIVERGGSFNRKSYLRYLIRQMAARRNVSYADLVADMFDSLTHTDDLSVAGMTMRSLLKELHTLSPAGKTESTERKGILAPSRLWQLLPADVPAEQLAAIEKMLTTLQTADQNEWHRNIHHWQHDYPRPLSLMICELGYDGTALRHWVTGFDDSALYTITEIINPQAHEAVHIIIGEHQNITATVRLTSNIPNSANTRNALWELTLYFLLNHRGSEFNQYQYLLHLTGQLSARYQIKTDILIHEWLSLSGSSFLWHQQLKDLLAFHLRPPPTAPQLLADIQSARGDTILSQQQSDVLRQYARINAAAMAIQLQSWTTPQLARFVRIMQPRLNASVIALLPLLLAIVHHFQLRSHWFYQLLSDSHCPATPEQWLQTLWHQITRNDLTIDQDNYGQLQQIVLNSHDIYQNITERTQWLYAISPVEELLAELQQWLEGKASIPVQALLAGLSRQDSQQQPLRQWLHRALINPHTFQRWLDALSACDHQAILFPDLTETAVMLLALRHAFCRLVKSGKHGNHLFWQTIYRQHWLKGIALDSSQFMSGLLMELSQLWIALTHQSETPDISSIARLNANLLPLIVSPSLQNTLKQIERQIQPPYTPSPSWITQFDRKQPAIQQLIEAMNIPENDEKTDTGTPWKKPQDETEQSSEPVTIYNAGLVIASLYIPMLFQRLALTDGHHFVHELARLQALFCLQWMTNHTDSAPEYQLLLNKVLCGIAPTYPIPQQVQLPEGAGSVIDGLLNAIIAHWKVLGNTSISGLQSTFFQREGQLYFTPKQWQLNVIPGTFDMLLDQLPWSFQTIKYPWMDKPLFVTWR